MKIDYISVSFLPEFLHQIQDLILMYFAITDILIVFLEEIADHLLDCYGSLSQLDALHFVVVQFAGVFVHVLHY